MSSNKPSGRPIPAESTTYPPIIVHASYPPSSPPPHPGPPYTRFVLLSDTHGATPTIPPCDVLLHAGDLSRWNNLSTLERTVEWLKAAPCGVKVVIAGNHDSVLDRKLRGYDQPHSAKELQAAQNLLPSPAARKAGIIYLEHSSASFRARPGGRLWTVYGSPGSPAYGSPAFQYHSHQAEAIYAPIPPVDIVLTHSPPLHTLDTTSRGLHAGCPVLAAHLARIRPKIHVFGHIHEGRGVFVKDGWVSVNAAWHSKGAKGKGGRGGGVQEERVPIVVDWREDDVELGSGPDDEEPKAG